MFLLGQPAQANAAGVTVGPRWRGGHPVRERADRHQVVGDTPEQGKREGSAARDGDI